MRLYERFKQYVRHPAAGAILNIATLVFGLLLLVIIGWRYRHTLDQPWLFDYRMVGVSLVFFSLNLLAVVFGWGQLVDRLSGQSLTYREHLHVYASTNLSKRLPGSFWYIAGRAVQYDRLAVSARITSLASILEYVLLVISSTAASLLLFPSMVSSLAVSLPILAAGMAVGLVVIHPRIIRGILKRLRQPTDIHLTYRHLFQSLCWYVSGWLLGGGMFFGIIRVLHPLPLSSLPAIMGFWCVSGAVSMITFFSPSGLGFREISLSVLLASQMPPPTAVAAAILARFILILFEFAWTLAALALKIE
jgi:uncharacterized membrane protein YbhN (UPF0104 family)